VPSPKGCRRCGDAPEVHPFKVTGMGAQKRFQGDDLTAAQGKRSLIIQVGLTAIVVVVAVAVVA